MAEAYHRALMAFPDEDVVVGSVSSTPAALEAFKDLDDRDPDPGGAGRRRGAGLGSPAGEAVRRGRHYDEKTFIVARGGQSGFLDHETSKPEKVDPGRAEMFAAVPVAAGGSMIVYGWTMAEDLVKLGRR
jgi:hypothetical protein